MRPILMWTLAYAVPSALACAGALLCRGRQIYQLIVIHAALAISIACSIALILSEGTPVELNYNVYSALLLVMSMLFAVALLGKLGAGYVISALVQEAALIAVIELLLPHLPVATIILLLVPIFSVAHAVNPARWKMKIPMTFVFGVGIILLYVWLRDPLLNGAMHVLAGTLSIRAGVIYAR